MAPVNDRQLELQSAITFTQFEIGDIIPHDDVARIQRRHVGAGIDPSRKADTPGIENDTFNYAKRHLGRFAFYGIFNFLSVDYVSNDVGTGQ